MNEPLNTTIGATNFSGKSHNNHPQWRNEPLRLTKEQKENPVLIIQGFFECFHLNEVREMLWEWLVEVISSRNSISNDGTDRSNHIYFYEKLEQVLEACFMLQKDNRAKTDKDVKFENNEQTAQKVQFSPEVNEPLETDSSAVESSGDVIFNNPEPLIEKITKSPIYVINQVFDDQLSYELFCDQLQDWLFVALATKHSVYDEAYERDKLIAFHKDLKEFIEGVYILRGQASTVGDVNDQFSGFNIVSLIEDYRIAHPIMVFRNFFKKVPMPYIHRQLYNWQEAGVSYTGEYPDSLNKLEILHLYQNTLSLIYAGYQVFKYKEQDKRKDVPKYQL